MIRIKIPPAKQINGAEVRQILGKNPRFIAISGDFLELPDDLTQTEIDNINTALYPDNINWASLTATQKIELIAKKLGVIT
ncbi:MAG: hypothetical protein HY363_03745 [Candidatus Aenigmarchaeota archaeon]|nr:hypothetical protein [Candidatus Aenigmarchaeota archaeon]